MTSVIALSVLADTAAERAVVHVLVGALLAAASFPGRCW